VRRRFTVDVEAVKGQEAMLEVRPPSVVDEPLAALAVVAVAAAAAASLKSVATADTVNTADTAVQVDTAVPARQRLARRERLACPGGWYVRRPSSIWAIHSRRR
jgi:DNA-binding sugar fermentation-stimulating protein